MQDVLREMKEVNPAYPSPEGEASGDNNSDEDDDDYDYDSGNDLSPEEMEVSQMVAEILFETIMMIKELIQVVTRIKESKG